MEIYPLTQKSIDLFTEHTLLKYQVLTSWVIPWLRKGGEFAYIIVEYEKYLYFDHELQNYTERWDLPYIKCTLPFASTKYMINLYITEYANLAYFDLEIHDFDLDPKSHYISNILYLPNVCYIKKEPTQYLSTYLSCGWKCLTFKIYP